MRLIELRVGGWQCFANEIVIDTFSPGLNVIHAPNGTGKSTLFDALRRAFFDGYRTSGREVLALRPWGRDLAPTVCVRFAHGGHEYRLEKRFLDGAYAKLSRREGEKFVALAEGDKADDAVRTMFVADAPGRGSAAGRSEFWGLAQVLWVPQGALSLGGVAPGLS
ncbi:MAG TPA: AAA family ATPase, partial [Tepidisphaeraceae bacterium]